MIRVVGSASRASAAASSTAVRATTSPTAAAATAAGTPILHIETNVSGSTRPCEMLMTAKMQALPTTVADTTATSAASHDQLPDSGALSSEYTVAATPPVSANRAALKASLRPRCLRCRNRAAATPTTCATTTSPGEVRTRPAASTRSLTEKVCESFLTWTWTGNASLIAKATAHTTHGRDTAVGGAGSGWTTTANSAVATAARAAVRSMIFWGTP